MPHRLRPRLARRALCAAVLAGAAVTLAACSSSPAASPRAGGHPGVGTPIFPAVSDATDLHREPVIDPGAQPAPTTLQTRDLVVGTGAAAGAGSTVEIQYAGASYDTGKIFDASWTDNGPINGPLSEFVPGFDQGVQGMRVGGRREIVIPPGLAYGTSGTPSGANGSQAVGPNETIVFVVDLLAVQ